jgi:hypothetical protein
MLVYQVLFAVFALSIPAVTLLVAGAHLWGMALCLRAKQLGSALLSLLAVAAMAGLFAVVGAVWFGYGVAHTEKTVSTDMMIILVTGVPFYAAAYGLWRFAGYLQGPIKGFVPLIVDQGSHKE